MNKFTSCNIDQAAVIRQYISGCELTKMEAVGYHTLLTILGYKEVCPGIRVSTDTPVKVQFGQSLKDNYDDEYYDDWEAAVGADIAANTSTSEPSESDTVGSVLRKEV